MKTLPSQEQVNFFIKYKIPQSKVLDATGMSNPKYQKIMDDLGFIAAIGVTPCQRSNHSLRDRHGHCLQCDVKPLAYAARFYAEASIYIAYSGTNKLVKIGLAGIAKDRVLSLNSYRYGGTTDWVLFRQWKCENVGRVENDAHKILEDFQVDGTYLKNGSNILCQELFSCTTDQAIEAVTRAIDGITTKIAKVREAAHLRKILHLNPKSTEPSSELESLEKTTIHLSKEQASNKALDNVGNKHNNLYPDIDSKGLSENITPIKESTTNSQNDISPNTTVQNELTIRKALENLKTPISIESLASLLTTPSDILIQQLHLAGVRVFSPQAILNRAEIEKFINNPKINIAQKCLIAALAALVLRVSNTIANASLPPWRSASLSSVLTSTLWPSVTTDQPSLGRFMFIFIFIWRRETES